MTVMHIQYWLLVLWYMFIDHKLIIYFMARVLSIW